jgi:hypothetical protein
LLLLKFQDFSLLSWTVNQRSNVISIFCVRVDIHSPKPLRKTFKIFSRARSLKNHFP